MLFRSQYHDNLSRPRIEVKSYANNVTLRNNIVEASRAKDIGSQSDVFEIANLRFEGNEVSGIPVD